MPRNPILDLPLRDVLRFEIAAPLQEVLHLYTVGSLLKTWRSPKGQRNIEKVFESPEQARQAIATCGAWVGIPAAPAKRLVPQWWKSDA